MANDKHKDLKRLGRLLDTEIQTPFGLKIGLDGLIGLIPGFGDSVMTMVSSYIVLRAAKEGYPLSILLRMLLNVLIDYLFGLVPVAGDVFDFFWKANAKNIALMEAYDLSPTQTKRTSFWTVSMVLISLVAILAGTLVSAYFLLTELLGFLLS